jgi:hypothetical protein
MDLVDRYVHAVGFWLPSAGRQDIVAELSEDLRSQIEEREHDLGRPLGEEEVSRLLSERGNPVLMASRYLPQRYLIGPTLFPLYWFVLKIVAAAYLLPWALVWIGFKTFDPAFRAAHGGSAWIGTIGAFWADVWVAAFGAATVVTAVFAVLERSHGAAVLATWDPRTLARVRDPNEIPRASSVIELAAGLVFCAWWVAAMASPVVFDHAGVRITLATTWPWFYWGYLALAAATLALSGANLLKPRWSARRAWVRLVLDLAGSAGFCLLCASNMLAEIAVDGVTAARALDLTRAINMWAARAVPMAAAVGLVIVAFDLRRVLRARNGLPGR